MNFFSESIAIALGSHCRPCFSPDAGPCCFAGPWAPALGAKEGPAAAPSDSSENGPETCQL